MYPIVDAHIHLHKYSSEEIQKIFAHSEADCLAGLIAVSDDFTSAVKTLALARQHDGIYPAIGYHPEQKLPTEHELEKIFNLIDEHKRDLCAVGEVGLPYYLRRKHPSVDQRPYEYLLEKFIKRAAIADKPIVLHAIYDDAPFVCHLLEKHSVKKAHFHWFKGDQRTVSRLISNGYFISVTPDIVYEAEIQQLVKTFPLEQMMVETDGPWPFSGPFQGKLTEPNMIHQTIETIAKIKGQPLKSTYQTIYENTIQFYNIKKTYK